jgi:PKD repeat protein
LQQGTGWTNIGTVSVTNPGGGTLSWSATDDRVWIEVTPTSNTTTTETDTVTVRATTAGLPVGTHTVTITFTGAGMTRTVSVILTVTAQPLIDLTVPSVTAPSTAERGQTISVAFTVRNQGTAAAGAFTNRVFLATTPHGEHIHLGDFPMPSLAAGTSSLPQTVSVTIHAGTPPGSYYLTVATDGHGVITETNEGNNMGSTEPRRISIDEGEPHIQFIEPSSGVAGDIVRIVGTNFPTDVGVGVRFGNELTDVISRAATEIKVRVPYPGDVYANVEVQIVRGILLRPISNTVAFTYNIPVLHYLYPSRGRAGETVVTLIGENFGHEETPRRRFRVWFGQSIPDVISWTNTRIELKAPSDWGLGIKHQEFLFDLLTIALTAAKEGTERAFELAVKALDFIFDFPEELGVELILREDEPLLTRSAKLLMAFAVPFDVVRVSPAGDVTVDVRVHKWQGELEGISNAKSFTFTDTLLIDIERSLMAHFASPGELRVYDSQGRVTGLVNGEAREEIPYSLFVKENNIVIILSATGTHYFEVAGTEEATYGLTIASVEDGQLEVFAITDVATTETTIDQFEINHEALVQARVVMKTDAGGDGVFEKKRELQLPRPSFTYSPVSPTVGQIITFDASGSSDPDGGIISYHWDFGDGTTGAGKVVEHTFGLAGNYTVTLTVTDNHGVVNSSSVVKALAPPVPPINWALIGGIIAAVVVVGLVALFFLRRRKRAA